MSAITRAKRNAKKNQGFELHPPRCANCQNYLPPRWANGQLDPRKPYVPPRCAIGGFVVAPESICDKWLGIDGAVLDL